MRNGKPQFLLVCGMFCLAVSPCLFANVYTQSEIVDLILARDSVLDDLHYYLDAEAPVSGRLRSVRNPEVRYSYGEDEDEILDPGIQLNQERDAWEVDLRVFIPNPYTVNASRAEAEASHFGVKAAAQDYLSRKLVRARELWAELRYTTSMRETLADLDAFWQFASLSIQEASADNLNLGPDLVSWKMDRFQFMEMKQDIESRHWSALNGLASLSGLNPDQLIPLFEPLAVGPGTKPAVRSESSAVLSQKSRVANERAAWAELQAVNLPWLDHVQGSYGELNSDFERESWSVQVAVSLPIFSILSSEASEQRALLLAEEASLELIQQEEQDAVFAVSELVDRKFSILKLYRKEILPMLASLTEQIAMTETGLATSLDQQIGLADSILRTLENYHVLKLELEQALIELETLQGVIP